MKLILPVELVTRLGQELKRAGSREIGGVLVGEHVEDESFRIVDLSVQRSGGSQAHFIRDVEHNRAFLDAFFAKTGRDYQRFNYLGEWHSHPLFTPLPSREDAATMRDLVEDSAVGVNFAILMIVSLGWRSTLKMSATAYRATEAPVAAEVVLEGDTQAGRVGWLKAVIDYFRS
jgi:integrative and conjugative element protein (TIGR02256 family)